jgi:glyoxylase-like metal-dependent hydrolase (beta-lactamase superfamily II)
VAEDTLHVGNVQLTTITDVETTLPSTLSQLYTGVEPEAWAPFRERYPTTFDGPDSWHLHIGGTLIRSSGRTILVDTGVGPDPVAALGSGPGALLEGLRAQGVNPDDIDTVFSTHAHLDHIGWNLTRDHRPTFPQARYVMHQADWEGREALQAGLLARGGEAYLDRALSGLDSLGVLDLLTGETALTPEVSAIPTPGHTAGSMSILINSGGEKAIITGDVMTHPATVTEPDWEFGFDTDAKLNAETRKRLLDRIEDEGMTLSSCHFPHPGFGKVIRLNGKRYWQAL